MIFIGTDDNKEGLHAGVGRYGADIHNGLAEQIKELKAITPNVKGWLKPNSPNDEKDFPIGHRTYYADKSVFKNNVEVMREISSGKLAEKIETEVVEFAINNRLIESLTEKLTTK